MTQSKEQIRITNQSRKKRGMLYDLKSNGARLLINVSPRENDLERGDWRVEAKTSNAPDGFVVTGWGSTRAEALQACGRSWASSSSDRDLPSFDWEAVASALTAVRAL